MKFIRFILFFVTICSFAQTSSRAFDFEFYKNGEFVTPKKLKVQIVKNSDTLDCEIFDKKIIIPQIKDSCTVLIKLKNKIRKIDNVNFSKLDPACKIVLGIENQINNFKPLEAHFENIYSIKNTMHIVNIQDLDLAKEVYFIVFTTTETAKNNSKKVKNYTQYFLVKKRVRNI